MDKKPNLSPEIDAKLDEICEREKELRDRFAGHAGEGFGEAPDYKKAKRDAQEFRRLLKKYIVSPTRVEEIMDEAGFIFDHSSQQGGRRKHHTDHLIEKMGPILIDIPTRIEAARIIYKKLKEHGFLQKDDARDEHGIEQILLKKFPDN
jgi:hypothetical protein